METRKETRKEIEEILLTDYGYFDDFTVDKIFAVVGRSEQSPSSTPSSTETYIIWDENQDGKLPPSI